MGVDWYPCDRCGRTYPDCGYYVICGDDCGRRWCSDECAKLDGFMEDEDHWDEYGDPTKSCEYCRGENINDEELLEFLLTRTNLTREAAVHTYFEEKNK